MFIFAYDLTIVVVPVRPVVSICEHNVYSRRSNVIGSRLTDRFGLQQMYQKRKQALERPTWLAPEKDSVTEVKTDTENTEG